MYLFFISTQQHNAQNIRQWKITLELQVSLHSNNEHIQVYLDQVNNYTKIFIRLLFITFFYKTIQNEIYFKTKFEFIDQGSQQYIFVLTCRGTKDMSHT